MWRDGLKRFSTTPFNPNSVAIFDVRELVMAKNGAISMKEYGWGAVQVFSKTHDGFQVVNSGIYQIPIFPGRVDRGLLDEMNRSKPSDVFQRALVSGKIDENKDFATLVVRIVDEQRADLAPPPLDLRNKALNKKELDQKQLIMYTCSEEELKKKGMFGGTAKTLANVIPNKNIPPEAFQRTVFRELAKQTNIEKYQNT